MFYYQILDVSSIVSNGNGTKQVRTKRALWNRHVSEKEKSRKRFSQLFSCIDSTSQMCHDTFSYQSSEPGDNWSSKVFIKSLMFEIPFQKNKYLSDSLDK